jgi:hypothetical protein
LGMLIRRKAALSVRKVDKLVGCMIPSVSRLTVHVREPPTRRSPDWIERGSDSPGGGTASFVV